MAGLTSFAVSSNSAYAQSNNALEVTDSQISWFGSTGMIYEVEHSTDLVSWTTHPMNYIGSNARITVPIEDFFIPAPAPDWDVDAASSQARLEAALAAYALNLIQIYVATETEANF